MSKFILLFTTFLIFTVTAESQTYTVSGSVKDTTQNKAVENAVVLLLTPGDSILYKFTRTDANGNYSFSDVAGGKYIQMTTHPFFADFVEDFPVQDKNATRPLIALTPKSKLLQELIIKSGKPIRVKGDTTIYTADSFKVSANANVEELLKKLPGIQVDKNGKITAMGEQVNKVLVDGEEFFGDDPGMAVKNIRADAVKEVQVFDKKSEQAEFTGIDDGNTQKTINLKLKEDKKKGYFGKIDLGGGLLKNIDNRYNANILLSSFKGKRKISGFFLTGNTGQDGLNWQDQEKFGGGNENMSMSLDNEGGVSLNWTGGNNDGEPYVNTNNGFIRNMNAGLQYSNKWNENHNLNLSPKYNSQVYSNDQSRFSQSQYGDSILTDESKTNTQVDRYNVKTSAGYEIKIDSSNTLKITTRANFYHTESDEDRISSSKGNSGTLKNTSNSSVRTKTDKQALYAGLLFKHRFKKARRTLSLNTDWNNLTQDGNNFLRSLNQAYYDGFPTTAQNIDQLRLTERSDTRVSARIIYTEPLSKLFSLELGYELSYTKGQNDQLTYTYSTSSGKYDQAVDSLTNNFTQAIVIHKPSLRVSYSTRKIKFSFGSGFGFTKFDLNDNTLRKDYIRNYTNFFPSAVFNYAYKGQSNLRLSYNGNTIQPTINQLQPLRNNTDYFNQYIGNTQLRPAFSNSFNLFHNTYNFLKDRFMYQAVYMSVTSNNITNNRVVDLDSGKTTTQPINTNGNHNIGFSMGMGLKIKKIDTRIDIGPRLNYSKTADVFNSVLNYSRVLTAGMRIGISKAKEKKYSVDLNNELNYNQSKTSQVGGSQNYFTYSVSLSGRLYFLKTWSISTDYDLDLRQKTKQINTNLSNQLWNARLEKSFRKDEFTAYLSVRDILDQNVGINRNFERNTFTELRNDRLQRYWMLGFAWNFKNSGAKTK